VTRQKAEGRRQKWIAVLLPSAFCLLTCAKPPQHPNVLLITLDTFRADRIGTGTPNLLKLAHGGQWFRQADSSGPLTLPSHATILSGLLPLHHGLRNNGAGVFPERETLATVFSKTGYRTAAFVSSFVLDRRFGLSRGFETYDDAIARDPNDTAATFEAERRGGDTVDLALAWLRRPDARPWFAWVHLYDAHAPYAPPQPYPQTYDGEVAYVDSQVGRLLSAIDPSKTVVVVVGDHGEALGEHGELTHGLLLYESTLRVPLIIADNKERGVVDAPISTVEVAPRIAALAGLELRADKPAAIYAETHYPESLGWSALTAIRSGKMKVIRGVKSELFDLNQDPAEARNIINEQRRPYGELVRQLDALEKTALTSTTGPVDEETRSKLASLGYIAPRASGSQSNRDPRDMAPLFRRFEEAQQTNAIPALEQLVREDPANSVFRSTLARAYKQSGAMTRALDLYRQAVALAPSDPDAWYNLAAALQESGRAPEAKTVALEAERLDPRRPDVHNVLGVAMIENGDPGGAEAEFRKAIDLDPRNARAYNNLGNVFRMGGRLPEARAAYEKALEVTPKYADALNGLGVIAVQQGAARQAIDRFDAALRIAPDFYEAQLNRAIALQVAGDRNGAAEELRRLVRRLPVGHRYDTERTAAQTLLRQVANTR